MPDAAHYHAVDTLRDGRRITIRAFAPADRDALTATVARISPLSLYRRFFTIKRTFSDREREFFLNVDFVDHVALVAWIEESDETMIAGGARYVVAEPGRAEVALLVLDQYQGQGIGPVLMHHLAGLARAAGLHELYAEVLPENTAMLRVFERCGLAMTTTREPEVTHVTLGLD
jgi:RimJ/RimL family protein N-acetyltransferase